MDRREFVKASACVVGVFAVGGGARALAGPDSLVRPPGGQDEARLLGACIHCDRCRSACPLGCIRLAALEHGLVNARTPIMDFTRGYCNFCGKCIDACPTQALVGDAVDAVRIGVAQLDRNECAQCKKCLPACEYAALTWDESRALPIVDEQACNGCGRCEFVCPSASFGYYAGAQLRAIRIAKGGDEL